MMKKSVISRWAPNLILAACMLSLLAPVAAHAQAMEAPAPRRMPRLPVTVEEQQHRETIPASRQVQGVAAIIDGEKLRIGDTDLRLFGIVPPQLSATFGPQARAALDNAAAGQSVTCQIRDRDRDGRLLATCRAASGNDLALELLKRGLAVTARGSLVGTELAPPYLAAEQSAQNQKIGLWSITVPAAAPAAAAPVAPVAPHVETVVTPTPVAAPVPVAVKETPKEEKVAPRTDKTVIDTQVANDIIDRRAQARIDDAAWAQEDQAGFFERYQILIAGFLMLGTALSIIGALWAQKRRDKSDETKAVGAALRGELMAARAVCIGRIKSINNDSEDNLATWPRIRATLYTAYVGRLGLLGAELARQVASIYGQAGDYAAFYSPTATTPATMPKKQALENLVRYIDEVLPKLAAIENGGSLLPAMSYSGAPRSRYDAQPALRPTPAAMKSAAAKPALPDEEPVSEESSVASMADMPCSAPSAPPLRSPVALWEAVRSFIQGHRTAIAQQPAMPSHLTEADAEYAAIIEEDMARHHYGENVSTLDISPNKPTTKTRTGS